MSIDDSIVFLEQIALYRILILLPEEETSVRDLSLRGLLGDVGVAQAHVTSVISCLKNEGYLFTNSSGIMLTFYGAHKPLDSEMDKVTYELCCVFHDMDGYAGKTFLSKLGMSENKLYYEKHGVPFGSSRVVSDAPRVKVKEEALRVRGMDVLKESKAMREAIESRPDPTIGMSVYYFDNDVLKVGVISKIEARLSATLTVDSLVYTVMDRNLHTESIAYNVFTTRSELEEWFQKRVESLGEL